MKHGGWVLKGGSNIYCRIPGARHTKDLDIYRQEEPTSAAGAAKDLVTIMDGHRAGPYTFHVHRSAKPQLTGTIESERATITVTHGINSQLLSFGVDISGDLHVIGSVEALTVNATYEVNTEILPQSFHVHSYPVPNQVADKVCAMFERHGTTPPGKASTRYHNLYDLALIAQELTLTAQELWKALDTQSKIRELLLPDQLRVPDERWITEYPKKARNFGGNHKELESLDEALRIAGLLLNPILSPEEEILSRSWDYKHLRWQ